MLRKALERLADHCVIIESHGPKFEEKEEVRKWIEGWIRRGSRVSTWDIDEFIFENRSAAVSWKFECHDEGVQYNISGVSIVHFEHHRITEIFEYMMTKTPYPGLQLNQKEE